jgi:hypothetical protein
LFGVKGVARIEGAGGRRSTIESALFPATDTSSAEAFGSPFLGENASERDGFFEAGAVLKNQCRKGFRIA